MIFVEIKIVTKNLNMNDTDCRYFLYWRKYQVLEYIKKIKKDIIIYIFSTKNINDNVGILTFKGLESFSVK